MASASPPGPRQAPQADPQLAPAQTSSLNGVLPNHVDNPEDNDDIEEQESTPLLRRPATADPEQGTSDAPKRHWWSIIAIAILLILTVNIIVFAFIVPNTAENYASQAATYSLRNIQIENLTDNGVVATAQVNITLDASRVSSNNVRRTGLFASNLFRYVYTKPCDVAVRLPEYGGAQLGIVGLPALKVDIRNRHVNLLNVTSNVTITDQSLAIRLASEYLSGSADEIRVVGETDVNIRAGIIPLGTHHIEHEVVILEGSYFLPEINLTWA